MLLFCCSGHLLIPAPPIMSYPPLLQGQALVTLEQFLMLQEAEVSAVVS